MYNHIMIDTNDDSLDFFNVKEFTFDETTQSYMLLSQNNETHIFQKENVKRLAM